RYVLNAVTLETIEEVRKVCESFEASDVKVVQIAVSDINSVGKYNMLKAQNPVFIFSFTV
ncbi:MAG: bifunctional cobalt-precorrin-7 (C(5))-methyltransferase/cobalt-precorrin-6B (C(15))-methyltransferase, partial [Lachnospiraceae bacterium]|nr:bifunctional cobalt-precorrin-7 (C(5))-methyltransferase/cobalt-precorrin-6B (C(15))-methyltransferase [Lachnospiraceae bacterium]